MVRGRPFEKGNKASKGGVPSTPEEKAFARLTRTSFKKMVRKYLGLSCAGLKEAAMRSDITALDAMVISVMIKAITTGDEKKMNWFLEQLFGKLKEMTQITHTGKVQSEHKIDISKLNKDELISLRSMVEKCQPK